MSESAILCSPYELFFRANFAEQHAPNGLSHSNKKGKLGHISKCFLQTKMSIATKIILNKITTYKKYLVVLYHDIFFDLHLYEKTYSFNTFYNAKQS